MRFLFCFISVCFFVSVAGQQLVLPGDHPDPSVVKIGDAYWASATTSNWAPVFPLLQSTDLVHWERKGHIFNQPPEWADYYFWAPEITYENGKVWVYYAAHKKGGNLCIGIASADKPEGPYTDHGPLICQPDGSIDAFPMRDESGKLFLIWKEDGNSIRQPTPIWAQQLNEERTALIGEKKELFRNTLSWEGNLVEGVSMLKHGDYFYAFYAGAGCCGRGCTYATGIARSKNLLGPWEKAPQPLLTDNGPWKCPGHGTTVEKDGRFYFLYHAYDTTSNVYTGRQGLLQEFRFTPDGWVAMVPDTPASPITAMAINDNFDEKKISTTWQHSVFQNPRYEVKKHRLLLSGLPVSSGAFLGQSTTGADYDAMVQINVKKSAAAAGLALIGDDNNMVYAQLQNTRIKLVQRKDGKDSVLFEQPAPKKRKLYLVMHVRQGKDISFDYGNKRFAFNSLNQTPVDGSYLPPWDRALRVGLISKGTPEQKAVFRWFHVSSQ